MKALIASVRLCSSRPVRASRRLTGRPTARLAARRKILRSPPEQGRVPASRAVAAADHIAADQQPQGTAEALPHGPVAVRDPAGVLQPPLSHVAPVLARRGPAVRHASGPARKNQAAPPASPACGVPQPPEMAGLAVLRARIGTGHRLGHHRVTAGPGRPASWPRGHGARTSAARRQSQRSGGAPAPLRAPCPPG